MIEHVGFRRFVKNIRPLYGLMTFTQIEADCLEIYKKKKLKLFEVLDKLVGKSGLTLDVWVSFDDYWYFCLSSHFINESWQLKKN